MTRVEYFGGFFERAMTEVFAIVVTSKGKSEKLKVTSESPFV
jgi:hypothetical protein